MDIARQICTDSFYTVGFGFGWDCVYYCITVCSEDCSLPSTFKGRQQGFAFQQSDSRLRVEIYIIENFQTKCSVLIGQKSIF